MYGEMKLALFIYLWYPKTMVQISPFSFLLFKMCKEVLLFLISLNICQIQGTGFVYDTLLRPYVTNHEIDIDRSLIEFRERAWNLAIYYWQNCTELGSEKILQFLQFVGSQSARMTHSNSEVQSDSSSL